MKLPKYRREYSTGHSYCGFTLHVRDRWLPGWLAEHAVEAFQAALGHPCCGKGPLQYIPGIDIALIRIESAVLNWGHRRDQQIVDVPLTAEQALAIQPLWRDDIAPDGYLTVDGEDDTGDIWAGARLVAVRCDDCGQLIDAAGRWSAKARDEHDANCQANLS